MNRSTVSLFTDDLSDAQVIQRQMRWEDDY